MFSRILFFVLLIFVVSCNQNNRQKTIEKIRSSSYSIEDNMGNVIGSGFAIKGDLVITNEHVVSAIESDIFISEFDEESTTRVELIFSDELYDIAVLKSNYMELEDYLLFSEEELKHGDIVFSCGSGIGSGGMGAEGAITDGVFSAYKVSPDGVTMIQHTASITNGNSGGPLTNAGGALVGVNTAVAKDFHVTALNDLAQSLNHSQNFALPSAKLKTILETQSLYDDSFVLIDFLYSFRLFFICGIVLILLFITYILFQKKKNRSQNRKNKVYKPGSLYGKK